MLKLHYRCTYITLTFLALHVWQPPLDFLCGRLVIKSPVMVRDRILGFKAKGGHTQRFEIICSRMCVVFYADPQKTAFVFQRIFAHVTINSIFICSGMEVSSQLLVNI